MTRRTWARLDNASNMFLAARSDADPKVFRMTAEMDHEVDRGLLQTALDATFDRYPLYRAVLRRGVFWYYLQDSDLRPEVVDETQHTCAAIYQADVRTLLFRVVLHRRRINLEVFHALSDGTGALWFLTDLVTAYVRLRFPDEPPPDRDPERRGARIDGGPESVGANSDGSASDPRHELEADSFTRYFRTKDLSEPAGRGSADRSRGLSRVVGASTEKTYTVKGTRTPDNRTRAVELTMPAADVLALARAEGVSLTMYLTALFFASLRAAQEEPDDSSTLAVSVPVNLRQYFPSTSARNFFTTVRLEHTYGQGDDGLGAVCRNLDAQFRPQTAPDALAVRVRRFIRFERMIALRIVPRPLKDVFLGLINRASNRGLTVAVSNLGNIRLPQPAGAHVTRMLFHVSAVRPQFCVVSHAGALTISFTSPFSETDHIREFARRLSAEGIDVTVAAARVTEDELTAARSQHDEETP